MGINIYNSMTKKKEEFVPIDPSLVKMYICGPTVYDFLHVGNFRGPVVFNVVRNWLEHSGYKVKLALNFTDVDDRIIQRAQKDGKDPLEISEKFIKEYKTDFLSLGLKPHDLNPKVTETMPEIIDIIKKLIESKMAYVAGGDVMFSIKNFPAYGQLSGRLVEDLQAGARVEVDEKKENPLDFALWKAAKPGEPSWDSPWGKGRPGWHIECSAMIFKHFGEQIDIHGGGTDLIFPHHENELAQSEGCSHKKFVNYWMHVHMLNFGGQKMSKSVGNIMSLREFLKVYNSEIYKWMILSSHYRSTCEFNDEAVHRAVAGLARVYSALALAESYLQEDRAEVDAGFKKITDEAWKKVEESLNDDFNTPEVWAALFDVVRAFNAQIKRGTKAQPAILAKSQAFVEFVHRLGQPMALFQEKASDFLMTLDNMLLDKMQIQRADIDKLVVERSQARQAKDFKRSDELRDQLAAKGISVMDSPEGSFWEVTK